MRHYSLKGATSPTQPALLFETDIDFHDVRSGIQVTESGYYCGVWLEGADELGWTPDMVCRVASSDLQQFSPPSEPDWPAGADRWLLDYLLTYYWIEGWKNSALGLYSGAGETREEFESRCQEAILEERFRALRQLQEIFLHRFFELEKRALQEAESDEWSQELRARRAAEILALFSSIREDLSRRFVNDRLELIDADKLCWNLASMPDISDRLGELKRDLVESCNQVSQRFLEQAAEIEPYRVRLTATAITIVSRNVLWR